MGGIPAANDKIITPKKHQEIIERENIKNGTWELTADAVVIGSGAGGAVAAATLAKNGWNTVLIEEGSYFTPAQFSGDEFLSSARLYRDAGFIISEEQTLSILQGRTVGGSTTVNWQTSLYPPDYVTSEWDKRFGLKGYSRQDMDPFVSSVHERLGVHPVPQNLINANNNTLMKGGKALGLHPEVLNNNNRGCIGLGRCGLGCPINAKQSMFLTYIPDAIEAGATVIANMKAQVIHDGTTKVVVAEFTPDPYEKAPDTVIKKVKVTAKVVVVSAGAIEGPALLQRSGLGNDWVGRNLKVHPTSTIFAVFDEKINMFSGPPQSAVIKDGHNQNNTGYGFWLEVAPFRPTLAASLIPYYGKQQFDQIQRYSNMSAGIVLVRDGSDGEANASVKWSLGSRKVYFELTPGDGKNMLRGLKMLAEVQAAAGAKELIFPFPDMDAPFPVDRNTKFDWILEKKFNPGSLLVGSAHPHGSIQAADSPEKGAVDPNLELYGHKNIFVIDASVYPTGLSVNPQITTMSLALRASESLASKRQEKLGNLL
ncbi:GMC family oxidoreductase N-terminal domain-containing protein [Leptospira sp. FAT2]|uniref:GMC family oxidoreductase N-terminal domain-containing protein n=1 Tax=Leptospira sanjuanensis TaxID=2879643 RepID=UPI001EE8B242|nr:GMC family oxidoreductase N-terminal domain-containing protein [Leptospira sanjuanensis]MCG6191661.1 GMC family oxidoreductase N-terminal domain-containing protein [Leptospira sanjuanensis]